MAKEIPDGCGIAEHLDDERCPSCDAPLCGYYGAYR